MTPEEFSVWLSGFIEVSDPKSFDEKQVQVIKSKLESVFASEEEVERVINCSQPRKFGPGPFGQGGDINYFNSMVDMTDVVTMTC